MLRRAVARLIDASVVLAVTVLVVAAVLPEATTMEDAAALLRIGGEFDLSRVAAHAVVSLVAVGYFALSEAWWGRTLGKSVVRVTVIGPDGHEAPLLLTFARNSWMLLPMVPWVGTLAMGLVGGLITATMVTSRTNTGWHDELVHTGVVKVR